MNLGIYFSDLFNNIGDNVDVLPILNHEKKINTVFTFSRKKSSQEINNVSSFEGNILILIYKIFLNRKEIDVFHVFCGLKFTVPFVIIMLKLFGIKVVYSPFGQLLPFHKENKNFIKVFLIRIIFKFILSDNVVVHCSSNYERLSLKKWMSRNVQFCVIPLSPNIGQEIKLIKKEQSEIKTILFFGRLDIWQKGLDKLISSVKIVEKSLIKNNYCIILAGRCSELDLLKIEDLVKKYELQNIIKIKPNVSNEDRIILYNSSDIFFHPSRIEGLARSMRDAIGFKIPILTTYDSNAGNFFIYNNIGWISKFNEQDLSKKLLKIISSNPNEIKKIKNNLKLLFEEYTSTEYRNRLYQLYKKIYLR